MGGVEVVADAVEAEFVGDDQLVVGVYSVVELGSVVRGVWEE